MITRHLILLALGLFPFAVFGGIITPSAVTSSTTAGDFLSASQLIDGSGLSSASLTSTNYSSVTHTASNANNWVTDASVASGEDYFTVGPNPVLTFQLPSPADLNALVLWGYAIPGNEAKSFLLTFYDQSGNPIQGSVFLTLSSPTGSHAATLSFARMPQVSSVRIEITDNFYPQSGGDRVGLGEVRFLEPTSLSHGTIEVVQNDANDTAASVSLSLSQGSTSRTLIMDAASSRGDYVLDFPASSDVDLGVLITSVAENGRDNSGDGDPSGTFHPTSAIDIASSGDEYLAAIHRYDPPSSFVEFNINTSFAWFPFDDWLAGHAVVSPLVFTEVNGTEGIDLGSEFIDPRNGIYTLDLTGMSGSSEDGILLVSGGNDINRYALSQANADGTFTIFCHDNRTNGDIHEFDSVAFAYIPESAVGTNSLVAMGRVLSGPATSGFVPTENSAGPFTILKVASGRWSLQLTSFTPDNGTLIVSPEGGGPWNVDNTISCEYQGNRIWHIESRDITGYTLQNGSSETEPMFSFAYFVSRTYVDASATGQNNGTSWSNAYSNLQDALDAAIPSQEIWVAAGTYYPDEYTDVLTPMDTDDRSSAFAMIDGISLYGGFPVGGGSFDQRDPALHETILSGDIDQNDGSNFANNEGNAYHVLVSSDNDDSALLDGFTITGGNANGISGGHLNLGGGLLCTVGSGPMFKTCSFEGNTAVYGGAVFHLGGGSPIFRNCSFLNNLAQSGGGAGYYQAQGVNPELTNCLFQGNVTNGSGGALSNLVTAAPTITNCSFIGNHADGYGGAIANESSSTPFLLNCSLQGNSAGISGGAIDNFSTVTTTLTNCILWNNSANGSAGSLAASVSSDAGSTMIYSHSLVQNYDLSSTGTNNFDGTDSANDPRFVAEVDPLTAPHTTGGDLRIFPLSPVLNAGNNSPNSTPVDLAGNLRIQNGTIDLGAYEGAITDPALLWSTDFDRDGNPWGVETALGTDPDVSDRSDPDNLSVPVFDTEGEALIKFGYNSSAPQGITWKLTRSTTLAPGSFETIFSYDGTTFTQASDVIGLLINAEFGVIDQSPPDPAAFYRFEAEYLAPTP